MRILGVALTGMLLCTTAASGANPPAKTGDSPPVWTFDADLPGTLPQDFAIGTLFDGRPAGEWKVLQTDRAKSPPHVLGQLMGKGAEHAYKTVLINGTSASDIDLQVSFLPIDGKADMGGGLIWRATDDRNYYLTRANPLEQNIRVYRVAKGVRHLLENFDQTIDVKQWHRLRVTHQGCRIQVFYDEKLIFDLCDETFAKGRIGLWTKSDAVTYFDDLHLQLLK
jgi:3-keto-disaccharide hydrolase